MPGSQTLKFEERERLFAAQNAGKWGETDKLSRDRLSYRVKLARFLNWLFSTRLP